MSIKNSAITEDLGKLFEVAWLDLPAATMKRLFASDGEDALRDAGWKAYDAWVRLANDASNRLYANPTFGAATGRGIQAALQVTRVVDAVASALFGNLWPAIGLPTATDVQALRADVKALREELQVIQAEAAEEIVDDDHEERPGIGAHDGESSDEATVIWNRYKPARKRYARRGGRKSVAL